MTGRILLAPNYRICCRTFEELEHRMVDNNLIECILLDPVKRIAAINEKDANKYKERNIYRVSVLQVLCCK